MLRSAAGRPFGGVVLNCAHTTSRSAAASRA